MNTVEVHNPELAPLWAVYDKDGTALTTLDNAKEGSYWAYKQGLTDTYVGPYPDAGRPMLPITTDCTSCDGTGHEPGAVRAVPVIHGIPAKGECQYPIDDTREPEKPQRCWNCTGFGYVRMDGYNGFKTEATFIRAKNAGKVKGCGTCLMSGWTQHLPVLKDCYTCKGRGKRPTWDPTRPILPPEVSDCDDASPEFMQGWLESVTITVNRSGRSLSWGEAHLGLVGMGSCVDYGRTWDANDDDTLIEEVVERISTGEQYIHMIDRRTRVFGPALIIDVTRNGYSIYVANVPPMPGLGALPPTYFPTVLQEM